MTFTDGSFTMDNLFLSPWKILLIAQEKKITDILGKFSYFIMKCMLCVLIRIASSRQF